LITVKPGQEQIKTALTLKERFPDKNFYLLLFDDLDFSTLENFPFVDCFVNTMCPRIAYDDAHKIHKPIVDYLDLDEIDNKKKHLAAH
jgi:diphthamide biosynthesis enzyme Dph1/Dph2-like protein